MEFQLVVRSHFKRERITSKCQVWESETCLDNPTFACPTGSVISEIDHLDFWHFQDSLLGGYVSYNKNMPLALLSLLMFETYLQCIIFLFSATSPQVPALSTRMTGPGALSTASATNTFARKHSNASVANNRSTPPQHNAPLPHLRTSQLPQTGVLVLSLWAAFIFLLCGDTSHCIAPLAPPTHCTLYCLR